MTKIKHVDIAPDTGGSLVTLFYEDGSKLAVTVDLNYGQPLADNVLTAVEEKLGLPNGHLSGALILPFVAQLNDLGHAVMAMPSGTLEEELSRYTLHQPHAKWFVNCRPNFSSVS